ncbi:MAG: hypothetical protein PHW82_10630 [Bacteroidales bacterium]|nr:hypothetical protein [Bacteroidales bacterium]
MKTDKYYFEQSLAPIIALLFGVANLIWQNLFTCKDPTMIISKSIDISFIIFGFLLTVLALILQTTKKIRNRNLYPRLIRFNKRIAYLSLTAGFYSLIYSSVFSSISTTIYKEYFVSIYIFVFVWIIIDLILFIRIFYKLAEEDEI